MIYYTNFSDHVFFSTPLLNTTLNQFYTWLINNLDETTVIYYLALDGNVAKQLQNIKVNESNLQIELLTNSKKIYQFIYNCYNSLNISQVQILPTEILLVYNNYKFVIRYTETEFEMNLINGVYVKKYN